MSDESQTLVYCRQLKTNGERIFKTYKDEYALDKVRLVACMKIVNKLLEVK